MSSIDDLRAAQKAERERRRKRLEEADPQEWYRHTMYHWSRVFLGKRLDYWPSTNKYRYDNGPVRRGSVKEFMARAINDAAKADALEAELVGGQMKLQRPPEGWVFVSADMSMANGWLPREGRAMTREKGRVMLERDLAGQQAWHNLPDEGKEEVALYATGRGFTLPEAMKDACVQALNATSPLQWLRQHEASAEK